MMKCGPWAGVLTEKACNTGARLRIIGDLRTAKVEEMKQNMEQVGCGAACETAVAMGCQGT